MESTKEEEIKLLCKDGVIVTIKKHFEDFSTVVRDHQEDEDFPVTDHDSNTIQILKRFLEDHEYDKTLMIINKPLVSDDLKDNVDTKTYELLKDLKGIENIDKMKPLVEAAYFFNFEQFKDACLACLACEFYVGPSEQDLEKFKNKHGIKELTPEEELAIMQEFEPVFEQLNKKFQAEMEEEQKKFAENEEQK